MATAPLEKVEQKKIIEYLTLRGWVVERMNSGKIPAKYGTKTRYISLHSTGTPDVQALRKAPARDGDTQPYTEVLYIEVKRPGEKPSEVQLAQHGRLREMAGARVIVATSWEDIDRELAGR